MVKPMADFPDIIIRTPEERAGERMPVFLYLLAEIHEMYFVRVCEINDERDLRKGTRAIWKFRDRESLHLFASMRIRELINEGMRGLQHPQQGYEHRHCYDRRTQLEVTSRHNSAKLEW